MANSDPSLRRILRRYLSAENPAVAFTVWRYDNHACK